MEKIRYKAQETKATCKDDKLVLLPEFLEKFLLVFLRRLAIGLEGVCEGIQEVVTASRAADHRSRKTSEAVIFVLNKLEIKKAG